jgi:hypothetical protein
MRFLLLVISFLTLCTLFLSYTSFSGQKLKLADAYSWDFGKVKEGIVLRHTFTLKNESPSELIIQKLASSCGCTASFASNYKIPPAGVSRIKVVFRTKGYSGKVKQFVYVHTNNPEVPLIKLTVEAQVLKKK